MKETNPGKRKRQCQKRVNTVCGRRSTHCHPQRAAPGPVHTVRAKDGKVVTSAAVKRFVASASPRRALGRTVWGGGGP